MFALILIAVIVVVVVKFDLLPEVNDIPEYHGHLDEFDYYKSSIPCNCFNVTFDNYLGMVNHTECICKYSAEELSRSM